MAGYNLAFGHVHTYFGPVDVYDVCTKSGARLVMGEAVLCVGIVSLSFSLQIIYRQQMKNQFRYSSDQLRIWNEIATLFLFAIVFLAVLKSTMDMLKGLVGLILLAATLMIAIRIYRRVRNRRAD